MTGASFNTIGLVGSGRMGEDIFYLLDNFEYSLVWFIRKEEKRDSAAGKFHKKLRRLHKAGALDDETFNRKTDHTIITADMNELSSCDLIIETIVEDLDTKSRLFEQLDEMAKKECVFLTNTSSIRPSKMCPDSERRDKFAGLHFFYPVRFNTIVELVIPEACSPRTRELLESFTKETGKQALVLPEDGAFILNKVFIYSQAQAMRSHMENILSYKEIDALIKKHIFTMGTFELMDRVGLDVILSASKHYLEDMEHKEFISVTIEETKKFVDRGDLGVKTGKGYYSYDKEGSEEEPLDAKRLNPEELRKYEEDVVNKILCLYINTAYDFVDKGYCTDTELDAALNEYKGMEKGPLTLGKEVGFRKVYELLVSFYEQTGEKVFYPSAALKKKAEL